MKIYLIMTEFDRSQYCEPDIDKVLSKYRP